MKFDKKTIITIVCSVAGVLLIGGVVSFAFHGKHDGKRFENFGCGGNQAQMMSGIENVLTTKDYTAFQKLFSGSKMLAKIDTQEKFTTRVEIQTTMKRLQELQAQLGSGSKDDFFGPMMLRDRQGGPQGCAMMERGNMRGNEQRRR